MASNSSNSATGTVYLDTTSADRALKNLVSVQEKLVKTIEAGNKAGKDMTKQLTELGQTKTKIAEVQNVIDKGMAPSLRELSKTASKLRAELNGMSKDAAGFDRKKAEYKAASDQLEQMRTKVLGVKAAQDSFGGKFLGFMGNIAGMVGIGVGIGAITGFLSDAVGEADAAEKATSRLRNTLENLGRGDAFDRITAKADQLAETFTFLDNDDITEVFQQLITYGKLTEKQMNDLLPVIINFAAKSGISINESASVVIKALEGNGKALKEYGVNMKDGATVTERLGIVMTELKTKVEGAADAFGNTLAGEAAKAKQEIANIKEEVGGKLQPVIKLFYQSVSNVFSGIATIFNNVKNHIAAVVESTKVAYANAKDILTLNFDGVRQRGVQITQREHEIALEKKMVEARVYGQKIASEASNKSLAEQERLLEVNEALKLSSKQAFEALQQAGKERTKEGEAARVQLVRDSFVTKFLKGGIAAAKDTRVLGIGDPDEDAAAQKAAESAAKKAAEARKKAFEEYNKMAQALNRTVNDILTPEASQKWIAAFRETEDELDKINKLAITHEQKQELITLALEKQKVKMQQLATEAAKTVAAPINAATSTAPAGFSNQQLPKKVHVQVLPVIAPEDEKAVAAGIARAMDRIFRDVKAGNKLDILNANNPAERVNALLKALEDEHDIEMQNKELTDNEKLVKEKEYQEKRKEIVVEYQESIAEYVGDALEIAGQVINIIDQFNQVQTNNENAALSRQLKANDQKKAALKKELNSKLISEAEYRRQVAALDDAADAKKEELERKQFERQKKMQIAQALVNGAMAVTNIWATTPKADFGVSTYIMLALSAAATLASIASISSAKYGKGGYLSGPSHSNGGMPVINPVTGRKEAEVEGGEVILSKNTVKNNPSAVNSLLFASLYRNGATVEPFWESRPYQTINYHRLGSSVGRRKRVFADGGTFGDDNTQNAQNNSAAAAGNERMEVVMNQILFYLQNPVSPTISQKQIENAAADKAKRFNEAALK